MSDENILEFGEPQGRHTLDQILNFYQEGAITQHEAAIRLLFETPSEIRKELKDLLNNEGKLLTTFNI